MKEKIKTVGELRELLRYSEDEEPIILRLEEGERPVEIECNGASSSAGGRATVLWFNRRDISKASTYQI